jgi:acetyl-CoA C-acetyltransferase
MTIDPRTPVLIGVGQTVRPWDGQDADAAPSPVSLCVEAARAALADTGVGEAAARAIDTIAVVRTNLDSVPANPRPTERCANPPATIAARLGLRVDRAIYSVVGGDQPQALVNEFAESIFAGAARCVMLTGAEAIAAMKAAARTRVRLDWSASVEGEMEDRGLGKTLLSAEEIKNGLSFPTQTYPIFENALRARLGMDRDRYRRMISQLWAGFSQVARDNPYAQFPVARDADFLATESAENYAIADPYLKWHVAQDAVNQGAAVILTSVAQAAALGVDPAKWVYLHGYAQGADKLVTERADLSRSRVIERVLQQALAASGKTRADLSKFDLYSCFPVPVLLAAEALGLDWRETALTVTGGLPFFGGPGNNYSMHAIASMVERLRADPGAYGLVLANGGFLSKEAAGVYSTVAKADWRPMSSAALQAELDAEPAMPAVNRSGEGVVESFSVTYNKGSPQRGYVAVRTVEGGRTLARVRSGHRATLAALAANDPIGRTVRVETRDGSNYLKADGRLGEASTGDLPTRTFKYVRAERRGHVLEVTLNRPDQMNALHSAAHFELHEIWDEFEQDPDLWAAIITGAGERAFCSGNDLKATARGADMTTPSSGFAGLCERFNREKPVIAAVNGVAMGGGMEIVLACDLAIAEEGATFALPEVKVGLFAAAGGVQRLTRQIGRKAAMAMILTGQRIGPDEALSLGVINSVAPKGGGMAAARGLADAILASSPSAVRASKQALNKLDELDDLQAALKANGPIFGRLMRTRDFKEGVTAFAEKRAPHWTNS